MARHDFLSHFISARNLYTQARPGAPPIWLTPAATRGFDAADFAHLGPDRQRELAEAVRAFGDAAGLPEGDGRRRAGEEAFAKVRAVLDPELAVYGEAADVEEALRSVAMPEAVVGLDYDLRADWMDVPSVYVTAVIDETKVAGRQRGRLIIDLIHLIGRQLRARRVERHPYVSLQPLTERLAR